MNLGQYLASLGGVPPPDEDPDPYRAKLRSIGVDRGRRTKTWVVRDERSGQVGGTQTEHRDGRVDACVHAPTMRAQTRFSEER